MDGLLKIQRFRTNDLVNNGGKQFELGRSWCKEFFCIDDIVKEFTIDLTFKALNEKYATLNGKHIELKIDGVNKRGDRKAYANSENGLSQIKDFFINDLHLTVEENLDDYFAMYKISDSECYLYYVPYLLYENFIYLFDKDRPIVKTTRRDLKQRIIKEPLQQITYGAPGTGKSFGLKDLINSMEHYRTTFHPDSDYASFVGAYKPTMTKMNMKNGSENKITVGYDVEEEQITYKFVPQAFINAYVSAWEKYRAEEATVLVIEEINRGNCAQIFGDLFQLLDRESNGFSSYPIEADTDVAHYLQGVMPDITKYGKEIDELFADSYPNGITDKIKSGELLLLPNNLYIWATMNTSDQSLFPIDSAFKRRWDWKFIKIADAHKGWFIQFGNEGCDWWTFISKMNKLIAKETSSDDKKMGYFFCKPKSEDEKVITEDQFVGKVLFYLWNDVFKDGDTALFNVSDDTDDEPTFEAFYNDDNTPKVEAIRKFIVKVVGEDDIVGLEKTDDGKTSVIDYSRYSFDGKNKLPKSTMGLKVVEKYLEEHANDSFDELKAALSFNNAKDEYLYYGAIARSEEINTHRDCYTEKEYISADSVKFKILTYWNKYNKKYIIDFAKQQGWEVKETEAE